MVFEQGMTRVEGLIFRSMSLRNMCLPYGQIKWVDALHTWLKDSTEMRSVISKLSSIRPANQSIRLLHYITCRQLRHNGV